MRNAQNRLVVLILAVLAMPGSASATVWYGRLVHINAESFQPHGDGSGWHVQRSAGTLPLGQLVLGSHLSYARNPVVWTDQDPIEAEVTDLVTLNLQVAIGFGPLDLTLAMPLHLLIAGEDSSGDGRYREPCVGALRITHKFMLIDPRRRGFGVGIALPMSVPTTQVWRVRSEFDISPSVLLEADLGVLRLGGSLGFRLPVEDGMISRALLFSTGLMVRPLPQLEITVELWGAIRGPAAIFAKENSALDVPVEWLAGAALRPNSAWTISLAGGTRIGRGIPSPDGRIVLGIQLHPPIPSPSSSAGFRSDGMAREDFFGGGVERKR